MFLVNYVKSTINGTSYYHSRFENKICRPSFMEGDNFILKAIPFISIQSLIFIGIISGFYFLFISFGLFSLGNFRIKKIFSFDDKLALGLAASIFIGLIISLSIDKFYKSNFCLMNKNDPICINENNDCFDQIYSNDLISGFNFGHGRFINITSSMALENKGIGKK